MSQTWRIVTYNTWKCDGRYRDRLKWMAQGLSALAPDILCLQEAFECPDRDTDTAMSLANRLGLVPEVLRARKKSRTFDGVERESWSNLAVLSKAQPALREDIRLVTHPRDSDRWAMRINFSLGVKGTVSLINTHLTHIGGASGRLGRQSQAAQLATLLNEGDQPVLLCGDLNATWDAMELAALRALNWEPASEDAAGGTLIGARSGSVPNPRRIDHIQVRSCKAVKVKLKRRFAALNTPRGPHGEYPSDHAAMVADVTVEVA